MATKNQNSKLRRANKRRKLRNIHETVFCVTRKVTSGPATGGKKGDKNLRSGKLGSGNKMKQVGNTNLVLNEDVHNAGKSPTSLSKSNSMRGPITPQPNFHTMGSPRRDNDNGDNVNYLNFNMGNSNTNAPKHYYTCSPYLNGRSPLDFNEAEVDGCDFLPIG